MLLKDQLIEFLARHERALRDLGVAELRLFGSAVRGEERPDSDIDVLVQFDAPPSFDAYMDLKFLLEDGVGRSVDLVTIDGLRDEIRAEVMGEALRVA